MHLLPLCLRVLPGILVLAGLGGVFGAVSIGPRELPKGSRLNRQLGATVILLAVGLALYASGRPTLAEVGLAGSVLAVVIFTLLVRQARRQYPPSANVLIDNLKNRYRFNEAPDKDSAKKTKTG